MIIPEFVDSTEAVLDKHGDELRAIIGLEFTAGWLAWDNEEDEWFTDDAVILQFGNQQLEACHIRGSELGITWNTVDLKKQPNWLGCWEDFDNLSYRKNGHLAIVSALGKTLTDINIVNYHYRTKTISDKQNPDNIGKEQISILLNALEFKFNDSSLILFNALDENGLEANVPINEKDMTKVSILDD